MKHSFFPFSKAAATRTVVAGMLIASTLFTSCKKDEEPEPDPDPVDKTVKEVTGTLTGDVTFYADTVYLLKGFVRVGADDGTSISATGKLTIQPGTLILGDRETKGTLIVQRGSQIDAQGTAEEPIVFTSERSIGLKQPGDWGGVVLCGKAKNNLAGGVGQLEGNYGAFHGGSEDNDNSGILKYVRIEYAGIAINPNQEVNSLTMGSVGNGTTISYVQCSFGLDDAFEWFGGSVNCDHLIAYRCLDDDWDVDNGFRGNVQFGLSIKDPNLADQSGSNGFEVDNDGTGSTTEPFTSGTFSNMTVIGPKANRETTISTQFQNALHLRRSNKIKVVNSFFTGFPQGVFVDGSNTIAFAESGELVFKNNVVAAVENWGGNGFGSVGTLFVNSTVGTQLDTIAGVPTERGKQHPVLPRGLDFNTTSGSFNVKAWFEANNSFLAKWQDAGINASLFEIGAPTLTIGGSSVLASGADFTGFTGFQSVVFKGAFGDTDWTASWTNWNPAIKDYLN
jgi:hypothetical protein